MTAGGTQQFTATGTYSDGSTQNLTASGDLGVVQHGRRDREAGGLATAAAPGTTTISATLGAVSGSTTLTVQAAPLSVTTSALAGGTVGTAYAATLAASGGTPPYTWSVASGALPAGLTLNGEHGGDRGHADDGGDGELHGAGDGRGADGDEGAVASRWARRRRA